MSLEVDTSTPPTLGAPSLPSLPPPSSTSSSSSSSSSNHPMITEGCLSQILQGNPPQLYPILQVLTVRESKTDTGILKYRMVLSDGIHFLLVLPASATFEIIQKEVKKHCLIQASSYSLNASGKRKVLCLLQFQVVSEPVAKIGTPCTLDSGPADDSAMDEQPAPPANPQQQLVKQEQQVQQQQRPQQPQQQQQQRPPQQMQQQQPPQQRQQNQPPRPQGQQQAFVPPTQQRPPRLAPQQNHQFQNNNRPAQQQQQQPPQQQQYQKQFQPRPSGGNNAGFQAKRPVQQNQSPLISADSPVQVHPIASLNPFQNRWVIKARVTAKSDIKTWNNQRGEGRLFSVDLLDQTGEIRAVGFNEAVDALYEVLQVGKVYYIARCGLKSGNNKFSTIQNNYELSFDAKSEVVPCNDQADDVPTINFSFVQIDHIENLAPNAMIDLLCVVVEADEVVNTTTKKGDTTKRTLSLVDSTGACIKLTVWGSNTETMEVENFPVYALKSLRVSDYNGRTLTTTPGTTYFMNPDIREAHELKAWYDNSRETVQFKNLSVNTPKGSSLPRKTFEQVRDEGLGQSEEPDNFYIKATVLNIPNEERNIAYPGCPSENCSKKVIEESVGQWHCEKCNLSFPNCVYKYSLSVNLADFTGQSWSRAFGNVSEVLVGVSADTAMNLKMNSDPAFLSTFQEALFKQYNLRVRAKLETFNDVQKAGLHIMNAYPVEYVKDSKVLLEAISRYDQ